ncbi:hypothetical protein [uncultured Pseudacidovorax sp.]|uniref:hypothetical protein n=1 Tax=uncultured Pseudacidovorax sp. TaxID=679313 RepID=UPI0025D6E79E|nr:hypothetical protein [uncultured Pseudacidovorax sp.]
MSLTKNDFDNGKQDLDHIAALATSASPTATDRFGNVKKTWAGIVAELSAAATILLARMWATKTDGPVADGEYSAKYHAQAAAASDASAEGHETGALAAKTAAELARDNAQRIARAPTAWSQLQGWTDTVEGSAAEVPDTDAGTHLQATSTGYNGVSVPNAGRYYWSVGWSRWIWISGTGLSAKANQTQVDALANSGSTSRLTGVTQSGNALRGTAPNLKQLLPGARFGAAFVTTNSGSATLQIDYPAGGTIGPFNIIDNNGGAVAAGTLVAGYYYEFVFTGSNFVIVNYGVANERIKRGTVQPLIIDAGTSTANALNVSTLYPATRADGTTFVLTPLADNTGPVTFTWSDGGPFNARKNGGQAFAGGELKAGKKYLFTWQAAGGVMALTTDGDANRRMLDISTMKVLSVGGTGDAITVTTEMSDATNVGALLKFVPTAANTGAATINVNGTGAFQVRKNGNQPLDAGDLKPLAAALFYFTGTQFLLIANGQIPTPTSDQLDANLSALQAAISSTPYGSQTYSNGVMTLAANIMRSAGVGDSLSRGAGSLYPDAANPNADLQYAPVRRWAEILGEELARVGLFSLPYEILGVAGSFDGSGGDGLVAQFAGRSFVNPMFVTIGGGTNSATTFGVFNQAGLAGQIAANESVLKNIIAAGAIPIVCGVMHPHPLWYWQQAGGATGDNVSKMVWPTSTFDVNIPYVVDAVAQTITGAGITANAGIWGTDKIGPGSPVQFTAGPNAGTHIVGSRSGDTLTITGGTLTTSESSTRRLVHVMSAEENMTLLPLPPSQRYQRIDRTGNGATMGLKLYDLYNAELGALAKRLRVPFLEIDKLAFDFVLANGGCALTWDPATRTMSGTSAGWDAGHTTTKAGSPDVKQFNHPNLALRQATFDVAFRKLARLIASGKFTRDVVIR